jgi:hypothetical protein
MSDIKNINLREMLEIKQHIDSGNFKLNIHKVNENENGSATINVEMNDEFMNWFKDREGLKRWSNKRFQKFFTTNLQKFLNSGRQMEK